jgi:hypothetical protein
MSKTLQAISEIHRTVKPGKAADKAKGTAAVAPKVQIIPPGGIFDARTDDEFKELTSGNRPAARVYSADPELSEEEAAKAVKKVSGGSTVKTPQKVEDPGTVDPSDEDEDGDGDGGSDLPTKSALEKMTKTEIVEQAEEEGLELDEGGNTKAELVSALMDFRAGDGEELL